MINSILKSLLAFLLMAAISIPCWAHVNSPDVYFQGSAGPYHLIVTVRTPQMIPGVATLDILSAVSYTHLDVYKRQE